MAQTTDRPALERHAWLSGLLLAGFLLILLRLFQIQVIKQDYYLHEIAPLLENRSTPLGPQPGSILARDRQPLAESLLFKTLIANPVQMEEAGESLQGVSEQLAPILKRSAESIYQQLESHRQSRFVELARFLPDRVAKKVTELNVRGLVLRPQWKRQYPHGSLAAHTLGGRDRLHRPLSGLEHQYRLLLDADPGTAREQPGASPVMAGCIPPTPGHDLLLTLDVALQRQVEAEMTQLYRRERPEWAACVVISPPTGEILALAGRPDYDPSDYVTGKPAPGCKWSPVPAGVTKNIPVELAVEQGSTFKILLTAAALDAGVITPASTFYCGGHFNAGGRPISCWGKYAGRGHGVLDVAGMLAQSCNVCASQIGLRLGAKRYCDFLCRAGIGRDPQAGFPAEAFGLLPAPERLRPRDLATMSFGQNVSCSSLQLSSIVAGIVNGGIMNQPHVLSAVLNKDGSDFRRPQVSQTRLCTEQTSASLRQMLKYTVEHGTGRPALMPDVAVGAKTGTAQQWDFANRRHYADRYMVSFIEVAPIDQPRYLIHVTCNQPKVGLHGSDVCGPVSRRIAEYALRRLERATPVTER